MTVPTPMEFHLFDVGTDGRRTYRKLRGTGMGRYQANLVMLGWVIGSRTGRISVQRVVPVP